MFQRSLISVQKRAFSGTPAVFKIIPEAIQTTPGKRPAYMELPSKNDGSRPAEMHVNPVTGVYERVPKGTTSGDATHGTSAANKGGSTGEFEGKRLNKN